MQSMHKIMHIQSQSNPMCAHMHKQKGTFIIYLFHYIINKPKQTQKNICYTQAMKFVLIRTKVRPVTGL